MKISFKAYVSLVLMVIFFTGCTAFLNAKCDVPSSSEVVWEVSLDDKDSYIYWDEVLTPLYGENKKIVDIELSYIDKIN